MRLSARCRELSFAELRLLARALVVVIAVRAALWVLPFRLTRSCVERLRRPAGPWQDLALRRIRQVVWAVEAASRRVPGATCLTQSLATQIMLGRLGQRSELHLGVARKQDGQLEAHAWVETQGRVVNGGAIPRFERFARLQKSS